MRSARRGLFRVVVDPSGTFALVEGFIGFSTVSLADDECFFIICTSNLRLYAKILGSVFENCLMHCTLWMLHHSFIINRKIYEQLFFPKKVYINLFIFTLIGNKRVLIKHLDILEDTFDSTPMCTCTEKKKFHITPIIFTLIGNKIGLNKHLYNMLLYRYIPEDTYCV